MSIHKFFRSSMTVFPALALLIFSLQGSAAETVASGTFSGASGHATSGSVSVVKSAEGLMVVLGADFNFDGAPDPKVGFGKAGKYDPESQLSPLQSNSGEQSYAVPDSVDPSVYDEIYIWCEKYNVPLGVAKIM